MIIDTSAVVSILAGESDVSDFAQAIEDASVRLMSAATFVEVSAVIERTRDPVAARRLDDFLSRMRVEIVPVTTDQASTARRAYWDYGKGSGHRAGLNFGDCFSYALARDRQQLFLFEGGGFVHADVTSALPDQG